MSNNERYLNEEFLRVTEAMEAWNGPPATLQRVCEVLEHPEHHYASRGQLIRCLSKVGIWLFTCCGVSYCFVHVGLGSKTTVSWCFGQIWPNYLRNNTVLRISFVTMPMFELIFSYGVKMRVSVLIFLLLSHLNFTGLVRHNGHERRLNKVKYNEQ
jgi:hypothetical protein